MVKNLSFLQKFKFSSKILIFNSKTNVERCKNLWLKIPVLLSILYCTNYLFRWGYSSNLQRLSGGPDGDCIYRTYGHRGEVPGYPTCVLADVIQNFYMARTLSLRAVGFDGLFKRISHKEFFLDGLGRLKIAQCSNIEINHDHGCISNSQKKVYMKYREPDTTEYDFIDQTWFYRSNLQCIAEKKMYGTNKFFNLTDSKN